MSATTQSADADTTEAESEDEGYDIYPQVTQHPESIVVGGSEIKEIVTSADLSSDTEDTGTGVGVVYKDPVVPQGTLWKNREVPDGFDSAAEFNTVLQRAFAEEGDWVNGVELEEEDVETARDRLGDEEINFEEDQYRDHRLKVDYKVADPSDREAEVQEVSGTTLGIDVGGGVFPSEEVDEFLHDEVMVWYGGISGQFIARALDFNGRPSARYKEDGYLVKGLFQHPLGWFDRDTENYGDLVDTTDRSTLAKDPSNGGKGRPPRFARPPVLREDIEGEEVFIKIGRYNGGNMMEATIAFNDFEGDNVEEATQIEPRYEQEPEEIIESEFDVENATEIYSLYHGDGWQPEPDNVRHESGTEDTSGASFDVEVEDDEDDAEESSGPTDDEIQFGEMISEKIAGSGKAPSEDIFTVDGGKTDLEGLVGHNADQFSDSPNVEAIREIIYENTSHLDTSDL